MRMRREPGGAGRQSALLLRVPYFILIYSVVHTYFRYGLPPRRIHAFPSGWLASFAPNYRKRQLPCLTNGATITISTHPPLPGQNTVVPGGAQVLGGKACSLRIQYGIQAVFLAEKRRLWLF